MTCKLQATVASASCAAALLIFGPAHPVAAQQGDIALVHALLLDRQVVVSPTDAPPVQAQLGHRLRDQDAVFTSPNTRAAIRFTDDGSLVRLNPNSQLQVLAEGNRSALSKTIQLEFGELWANVTRRPGTDFQVRTPSGVAAVKGTILVVRVQPDGGTTVMALEDEVEFTNNGGTTTITTGNQVTVTDINQPPVPEPITDEDTQAVEELIDEAETTLLSEPSVQIEVRLQNSQGQVRTLLLEVPRSQAQAILGAGGDL